MEPDTLNKLASSGWADFHTEFKIPRGVRKQIRRWVDRMKWPEGHEKHDARQYHITVLDMDKYDEDFAKWAKKQVQGLQLEFKSTGMAMFKDFVVVTLHCPEWERLAKEWTEEAERRGLEPHTFPGGPRSHISVGKAEKWPQGIPNPHIKFKTRMFNIKRNGAQHLSIPVSQEWYDEPRHQSPLYHGTTYENAQRILQEGLKPWDDPSVDQKWGNEFEHEWLEPRPGHVYLAQHPSIAQGHSEARDEFDHDYYEENPDAAKRAVLRIDPSYLSPENFNPDEDTSPMFNENPWEEIAANEDWENEPDHKTLGEWAENTGYGNNPAETGRLIDNSATMAYRGAIPPEAISLHEVYDPYAGGWARPGGTPTRHPAWPDPVTAAETTPADDMKKWFDSFAVPEPGPISPYHTNEKQFVPYQQVPVAEYPHIDPPKQPYKPYNWAEEGWEESPMNRTAGYIYHVSPARNRQQIEAEGLKGGISPDRIYAWDNDLDARDYARHNPNNDVWKINAEGLPVELRESEFPLRGHIDNHPEWTDPEHMTIGERMRDTNTYVTPSPITPDRIERLAAIDTHKCPQCGAELEGQLCGECGYDPYDTSTDYDKAKNNWYDRAWSTPENQPFPTPYQEKPWREDHASDVSLASVKSGWHGF